MASIFTYEPDPPRVASPWMKALDDLNENVASNSQSASVAEDALLQQPVVNSCPVTRLQAEPQEGPVEYKLHLLLRPRRTFKSTSTPSQIYGTRHSYGYSSTASRLATNAGSEGGNADIPVTTAGITQVSRQHRVEQLTTQLLWRLQQSSPHHSSSASNTILPTLPLALTELEAPQKPAKLLQGLEESQGALYEIGVSDDGTLVGLTEDEMKESLNNLRAMAACLGCTTEVLRQETVGWCEWIEEDATNDMVKRVRRTGKLIVAEAFVKPVLGVKLGTASAIHPAQADLSSVSTALPLHQSPASTEQLRVTLTGPTMSGKSTLLGTLTTSTLDNGRGHSRLSMLRHRHEITTGITSSVTQELLGYQDAADGHVNVINYACENVASWIDVHNDAAGSRLVFVSDSAGHPKYRRTTIRSLVGWAPHWTLLCIAADESEDTAPGVLGLHSVSNNAAPFPDLDLSAAQLELCLRLKLPMVIVVTKLDMASRAGLKRTLSKILDALKAASRKPVILPNVSTAITEVDLQIIPTSDIETAYTNVLPLLNDSTAMVPIVLTSAVKGTGLRTLHALLHELPLPEAMPSATGNDPIFHVEDIYSRAAELASVVISGHLRKGSIAVGEHFMLGPFSTHEHLEDSEDSEDRPMLRRRSSGNHSATSRSFPGALPRLRTLSYSLPNQEWKRVRVVSIRNLRLPVMSLLAGQAGTIAIVPEAATDASGETAAQEDNTLPSARIRKGMVLIPIQTPACRTVVASFARHDAEMMTIGSHVIAYSASVRASVRIISCREPDSSTINGLDSRHAIDEPQDTTFSLDEDEPPVRNGFALSDRGTRLDSTSRELQVTFRFEAAKEFVVIGDMIMIMSGGGPGLYGNNDRGERGAGALDGYVGRIIEAIA